MLFNSIEAFVQSDFLSKLAKNSFSQIPEDERRGCTEESLFNSLKQVVESNSTDVNSYLNLNHSINPSTLDILCDEYQSLLRTEIIDDKTYKKIDKVLGGMTNPDMLISCPDSSPVPEELYRSTSVTDAEPMISSVCPIKRITVETPLPSFYTQKGTQSVKKEYFRCQYIRAAKKAMRMLTTEKIMSKGICPVDVDDERQFEMWNQLKAMVNKDRTHWENVSPAVAQERSFNNRFCLKFFADSKTRRFHYLFCELTFSRPASVLCTNIKIKCCLSKSHTSECDNLWLLLKDFAKFGMLEELSFSRVEIEAEDN